MQRHSRQGITLETLCNSDGKLLFTTALFSLNVACLFLPWASFARRCSRQSNVSVLARVESLESELAYRYRHLPSFGAVSSLVRPGMIVYGDAPNTRPVRLANVIIFKRNLYSVIESVLFLLRVLKAEDTYIGT